MRSIAFVVFILPVIFSLFLGTFVMAEVLKDPSRDLNVLQFEFSEFKSFQTESLKISGLANEYSKSESIEIKVSVTDPIFDCGDLYITIFDLNSAPKQAVTQSGFFEQCYGKNNLLLPIDDEFSETIDTAGQYEIQIEMKDKSYQRTITASEKFRVR